MVLPPLQTQEFTDRVLALEAETKGELDQTAQSLQEIALLLQKTNQEVEKLAARELQLSNRVRDMEMHLDNYARQDIRDLYTASHEVQLRLFMMRSQAEQLQNRQQHVKEYQEKLQLLVNLLGIQDLAVSERSGAARTDGQPRAMPRAEDGLWDNTMPLIEAQEEERYRVAHELQDGPAQAFTNLMLQAEVCERLVSRDVDDARAEIQSLKDQIKQSLQDSRRLIFDLRPLVLDDLGLAPTIDRYLSELVRMQVIDQGSATGSAGDDTVNTTMQVALFRFVQIVVSSIVSEGPVTQINISVDIDDRHARIQVDSAGVRGERASIEERLDSEHLARRLRMLKGSLVTEQRPNKAFYVEITVPIPEEVRL
jgi:two-component system sensor histidine kinase DegS